MNRVKLFYKFSIKLINEFCSKWKYYSFSLAFYNLIWWICFYIRPPFALKLSTWAIKKKTQWFDKYLSRNYKDIINRYKQEYRQEGCIENYNIWVFWGQGEDNMPPLIQACYRQLTHFNKNVVLITMDNIDHYVSLPNVIYKRVREGTITWAYFSDIVRTTLLAKYGGLWLDATVWISGTLSSNIFENSFFTACSKVPISNRAIRFWTSFEWNWSGWCMASNHTQHIIFSFVSKMLQAIAINEKYLPDYVIIDYLIYYACRNFHKARQDMKIAQNKTSPKRNYFATIMNNKYDETVYRELIKSDFVFKLSFRAPWKTSTSTGELTFYGRILNGIISINK